MSLTRQSQSAQPAKKSKPIAKRATFPTGSRAQAIADSPEQLSQLQRQYGNRAVQRLIQRAAADENQRAAAAELESNALEGGRPSPLSAAREGAQALAEDLIDGVATGAAAGTGQRQENQAQTALPKATGTAPVQRAAAPAEADLPAQALEPHSGDGFEAGAAFENQLSAARGGQPLPGPAREFMEQRMGADFSGVKVHTDAQSNQLNQAIQAKAFTTGQDVFFRQGEYDPASRSGQALLAHELTHVVQQTGGAVQRSSARVQRKFTFVEGGSGEFDKEEQESFGALLANNNIDPLVFTAADFAALQTGYDRLAPLVAKVGNTTAQKKRTAQAALKVAYTNLGVDLQSKMLAEGKPAWDAAVGLAVQQFNALPDGDRAATEKNFTKISEPVWPTVGGRGAMPASFWKSVKKNIKTAFAAGAAVGGAGAFSADTDAVYADMGRQFAAWSGTLATRGAWWGSAVPGDKTGAKDVPSTVIRELERKTAGAGWRFSNSFSGGLSFHKPRGTVDFIYHMQAASN